MQEKVNPKTKSKLLIKKMIIIMMIITFVYFLFEIHQSQSIFIKILVNGKVVLISNYNHSAVHDLALLSQPITLNPVVTSYAQSKSNIPLTQIYNVKKYQLKDIQFNHSWTPSQLTTIDQQLMEMRQPPLQVFSENRIMIQDYQILENRHFKIYMINPSQKFKICISQIFSSAKEIKRIEKRLLPLCMNQQTKYPFQFNIHISQQKQSVFRATIYFIVNVYYQNQLVDEKIWPRQILIKLIPNYLNINYLEIWNCSKDLYPFKLINRQQHQINISFAYKKKIKNIDHQLVNTPLGNLNIPGINLKDMNFNFKDNNKQISLSPMKEMKLLLQPEEGFLVIHSKLTLSPSTSSTVSDNCKSCNNKNNHNNHNSYINTNQNQKSNEQSNLPSLHVPIYCLPMIMIDYFNIGILSNYRAVIQIPITVTSSTLLTATIEEIELKSNSQTVQLLPLRSSNNNNNYQGNSDDLGIEEGFVITNPNGNNNNAQSKKFSQRFFGTVFEIPSFAKHLIVCRMLIKASKMHNPKSTFDIILRYTVQDGRGQIHETRTRFVYGELRNPISVDNKRFIDISKSVQESSHNNNKMDSASLSSNILDNIFPLRNNLNLPVILSRVRFDQKKFKLSWLQDKRNYIYPSQQASQFALQYIGQKSLTISPQKHLLKLDFYGHLTVLLEVVIFDNTLQCIPDLGIRQRCSKMPDIDLGYLKPKAKKTKTIQIRNWDPQAKDIMFSIHELQDEQFQQSKDNKSVISTKQHKSINTNNEKYDIVQTSAKNTKKTSLTSEQLQIIKQSKKITKIITVQCFFPNQDSIIKQVANRLIIHLKGNHHLIVNITIQTFEKSQSGSFEFRIQTQNEKIVKYVKYRIEDATIAILPQSIKIQEIYKNTMEYMNLVSTYSLPYKVSTVQTNITNIEIHFNDTIEIEPNQWVGMALFYQPFSGLSHANITQKCCGEKFLLSNLKNNSLGLRGSISHQKGYFQRPAYINGILKITTTTGLQAYANIIVANGQPRILESVDGRVLTSSNKEQNINIPVLDIQQIQSTQLILKNNFEYPLKFKVKLIQKDFIDNTINYLSYFKQQTSTKASSYFCVSPENIQKLKLTSDKIKSIFRMENSPQQLQVSDNFNGGNQFFEGDLGKSSQNSKLMDLLKGNKQKNSQQNQGPNVISHPSDKQNIQNSEYILDQIMGGAKYCYKLTVSLYLKTLIQTGVLNQLAHLGDWKMFSDFVNRQYSNMLNINAQANLSYQPFYEQLSYNQKKLCSSGFIKFPIFRFCKHINFQIEEYITKEQQNSSMKDKVEKNGSSSSNQKKEDKNLNESNQKSQSINSQSPSLSHLSNSNTFDSKVIPNDQSHKINFKIHPNSKVNSFTRDFYLTIINNYTKVQTHMLSLIVSQPKLQIQSVIMDNNLQMTKEQLETHYFTDFYEKEVKIKSEDTHRVLPLYVTDQNLVIDKEDQFFGTRIFQLKNVGDTVLKFTHIGIQNIENICEMNGISIKNGNNFDQIDDYDENYYNTQTQITQIQEKGKENNSCSGFQIKPNSIYNLTIKFNFIVPLKLKQNRLNIFIYNSDKYYIKLSLVVKIDSNKVKKYQVSESTFGSFLVNLLSFCFISLIVWMIKQENQKGSFSLYPMHVVKNMIDSEEDIGMVNSNSYSMINKGFTTDIPGIHIKNQIFSSSRYSQLGTKVSKRSFKSLTIPEDKINALKELQDKQAKQQMLTALINQSGQSQVNKNIVMDQDSKSFSRQQIEQQMRQQNGSMSQQSSLDLQSFHPIQCGNIKRQESHQSFNNQNDQQNENSRDDNKLLDEQGDFQEDDGFNSGGQQVSFNSSDDQPEIPWDDKNKNKNWSKKEKTVVKVSESKQEQYYDPLLQKNDLLKKESKIFNVFFSENPLNKKKSNNEFGSEFHWMNQSNKRN